MHSRGELCNPAFGCQTSINLYCIVLYCITVLGIVHIGNNLLEKRMNDVWCEVKYSKVNVNLYSTYKQVLYNDSHSFICHHTHTQLELDALWDEKQGTVIVRE